MDLITLIGIIASFAVMVYGIMGNGEITSFIDVGSIVITIGGTITTVLSSFPLKTLVKMFPALKIALFSKKRDPIAVIDTIAELADQARKSGLLSLEDKAEEYDDEFLKRSILTMVDTHDQDEVRETLETQIAYTQQRHAEVRAIFDRGAAMAPAFGMIGTLIGLVNMLKDLDDPDSLGPAMAIALITTFYGSLLSNVFFQPVASKLKVLDDQEVFCRELIVEGVLAIQVGENPRVMKDRLLALVPPADVKKRKKKGDDSKE